MRDRRGVGLIEEEVERDWREWRQQRGLIEMCCVGEKSIFNRRKIAYRIKERKKEKERKSGP